MANTIRIKRRASGGASGAPSSLENAELAYNEADDTLYYGKGTGGAGGTATTVEAIAGAGAYVTKGTSQTITGNKSFSGTVSVATPSSDMHAATKKYVDDSISGVSGSITVAGDSGSSQTVSLSDTLTISGGTGLSSVASATDTLTINLDNTAVTAGSYGSSNSIPTFTVDAQGRLTAAGSASISTSFTLTADSGSNQTISGGDTFTIAGGTGIDTVASATDTLTINIDSTVVTLTGSQELTNKTITSPSVSGLYLSDSSIVFEGSSADAYETTLTVTDPTADRTLTLPNATDTLVGKATTDTFTNKTFDTAGTGNSFSVNGNAITSYVGSGNNVVLSTNPTITNLFANGLTVEGASIVFEGATADDYETTLTVTDPTADRTITLPNATGTVALTSDITTAVNAVPTTFTLAGDSGSSQTITIGSDTLTISGGTGLSSVAGSTDTVTINLDNTAVTAGSYGSSTESGTFTVDAQGRLTSASSTSLRVASTTQTGIASFDSGDFSVSTGQVSIKSGGVDNAQLANSTITLGSSTLTLGQTTTSVAGITELTVDNLNFNGNSITSTDTNGNITLSPNGTGTVDVASSRITGLSEPTLDTDAATKYYVDNKVSGLDWKAAVNLIAKSNVSLTGSTETLVIDGHAALDSADDGVYRILLTAQSTGAENGIYTYTDDGTDYELVRAADADVYTELIGASVYVMEGTTYTRTGWVQTNHYITSFASQNWVQFSGAGAYAAGSGLSLSGTEFNINVAANGGIEIDTDALQLKSSVAGAGLTYSSGAIAVGGTADKITVDADAITIASTYIGQSSITTLGTIGTGTWQGNVVGSTYGGTGVNNGSSTITLGGNLVTSGANALTLTTTNTTNVTLPTTGTLATLSGSETLTAKTITNSSIGSSNPSTAAFTTLSASGATTLTANTTSTSYTSGTLVVTGGVGVSGALYGNSSTLSGFVIDGGTF